MAEVKDAQALNWAAMPGPHNSCCWEYVCLCVYFCGCVCVGGILSFPTAGAVAVHECRHVLNKSTFGIICFVTLGCSSWKLLHAPER